MSEQTPEPTTDIPWPNQEPVVDGIVPVEEVPQDEDFLEDDDLEAEADD